MAGMTVESLIVSLGLDPREFTAGLNRAFAGANDAARVLNDFLDGFRQGMTEAVQEAAQGADNAARNVDDVADAARNAGNALENAGRKGRAVLRETAKQAEKTGATIRNSGSGITELGNRWGSMLKGIVTRFAAPVLGAFATGAMVNSYFSGVADVARMTGSYTTQMEEWRKKRELLSRVTREDIELYRKGKLALLDFNFAMAGLAAVVMRALSPVFREGIKALHGFSDWVRRNEHNIVRFLKAVAIVVTAALIPAFVHWGRIMLANPITWIILAIVALVAIIDDLLTYMNGGRSLLSGFWSRFGTGKEVAEKLGRTLDNLKRIFVAVFGIAKTVVLKFFEYFGGAFAPVADIFENHIKMIASLLEGDFSGAFEAALGIARGFKESLLGLFSGLGNLLVDLLASAMKSVSNFFGELFQGLLNDFLGWIKSIVDKIPPMLKPEGLKKWSASIDAQMKQTAADATGNGEAPPDGGPDTWDTVLAAVPPSATTNQSSSVETNTTVQNVNVFTQATDADGIARDMKNGVNKAYSSSNTAAADGGVR